MPRRKRHRRVEEDRKVGDLTRRVRVQISGNRENILFNKELGEDGVSEWVQKVGDAISVLQGGPLTPAVDPLPIAPPSSFPLQLVKSSTSPTLCTKLEKRHRLNKEEREYLESLSPGRVRELEEKEEALYSDADSKCENPLKMRLIDSCLPGPLKRKVLFKLNRCADPQFSTDASKFHCWAETLLATPYGKYSVPRGPADASQLTAAKAIMDAAVYGHDSAKQAFVELLGEWLWAPGKRPTAVALEGPCGNGKTTLIRNGLAKACNRPFAFVPLGGCQDGSYLLGHGYTYEGSQAGRIIEVLSAAGCTNPVIYFDELDKVSSTPKGEEIVNVLMHLTDPSQNDQFRDRYLHGLTLDLSMAILVFSFNDRSRVHPILLDRLQTIQTQGFSVRERGKILLTHIVPQLLESLKDKEGGLPRVQIGTEAAEALAMASSEERCGMRPLAKQCEQLLRKALLWRICKDPELCKPLDASSFEETADEVIEVTRRGAELYLKGENATESRDRPPASLYS